MINKEKYNYFIEEKWYVNNNDIINNKTFKEIKNSKDKLIEFKDNIFKFIFVGVITFGDEIIIVLPKYYNKTYLSEMNCIEQIIKILKKIPLTVIKNNKNQFFVSNRDAFNEIALCDHIIKDYIENGIYTSKIHVSTLNENSNNLDWKKTINELTPIISNGVPIYNECYYNHRKNKNDDYIRQIHIAVLEYSIAKYAELLGYKLSRLNYDKAKKALFNLGNYNKVIMELNNKLTGTFNDREILLLKTLISFFVKTNDNRNSSLALFGTSNFELVWEYVCSKVFENEYDELKDQIEDITWKCIGGNPVKNSLNTLKPDILRVVKNNLLILDAKYYLIKLSNDEVDGNPSSYDIVKQFTYSLAFEDKGYDEIINCLLYPREIENFSEIFGSVNLTFFKQKPIVNIYISPSKMYDRYLKGNNLNKEELNEFSVKVKEFIQEYDIAYKK